MRTSTPSGSRLSRKVPTRNPARRSRAGPWPPRAPRAASARTPPRRARRWKAGGRPRPPRPTTGAGTPPRRQAARASGSSRMRGADQRPDHLGHQRLALLAAPSARGRAGAAGRRGGRRCSLSSMSAGETVAAGWPCAPPNLEAVLLQHRPGGALVSQGDRQQGLAAGAGPRRRRLHRQVGLGPGRADEQRAAVLSAAG